MTHLDKNDFKDIIEHIEFFEKYLKDNGVFLHPKSVLASDIQKSKEVFQLYTSSSIPDDYPIHESMNSFANVSCLSTVILDSQSTSYEAEIKSKLPLLKSGVPRPITPDKESFERNLLFEVICGYICSKYSKNVKLVDPDVKCDFNEQCWGLACKSAFGQPNTIVKKIRKGINQINKTNVNCGFVVVQLTNLFPHDAMYHWDPKLQIITSLRKEEDQLNLLNKLLMVTVEPIENERKKHFSEYPLEPNWKVRGIIYLTHTLAYFRAMRIFMGAMYLVRLNILGKDIDMTFSVEFNYWLQNIAWAKK